MPDLIRHPVLFWIPAFAGMTTLTYIVAGVITYSHPFRKEVMGMKNRLHTGNRTLSRRMFLKVVG